MINRPKVVQPLPKWRQELRINGSRASGIQAFARGSLAVFETAEMGVPGWGSGMVAAVFGLISIMDADEQAIIDYLKGWPNSFVSGREIARKVGGKERFGEDRGWALSILAQLVRLGAVESDQYGYYRLKQEEKKKREKTHVSPQILKILKSSGKSFDNFNMEDDMDEPPVPAYRPPSKPPPAQVRKKES